jgi:hypothetical protein
MQTFPYSVIGAHGEVLATGTTTDRKLIPGELVLDQTAPPNHWWDGQRFVGIPAQPSPAHLWDWGAHQWVDGRDVDAWRRQKWAEVKHAREAAIAAGVTVAGLGVFDADERACAAVQRELLVRENAGTDYSVRWTMHAKSGNAGVDLKWSGFGMVAAAILGHIPAMHAIARQLRDQIDAPGATVGELAAIRWPNPP